MARASGNRQDRNLLSRSNMSFEGRGASLNVQVAAVEGEIDRLERNRKRPFRRLRGAMLSVVQRIGDHHGDDGVNGREDFRKAMRAMVRTAMNQQSLRI